MGDAHPDDGQQPAGDTGDVVGADAPDPVPDPITNPQHPDYVEPAADVTPVQDYPDDEAEG